MRMILMLILAIASAVFGADGANLLVGTWKLVSWQIIADNEPPQNIFGTHPKGYLILTPEGRTIVLTTADSRVPGMADAQEPRYINLCSPIRGNIVWRVTISSLPLKSLGMRSGMVPSKDATFESKAIDSSLSRHPDRASYSQARLTFDVLFGNEANEFPHITLTLPRGYAKKTARDFE